MDRFTGWKRSTMVAALVVLTTGACAQRASPPVAQAQVAPTPVVAQAAPAPAATPPVRKAPAPKPAAPAVKTPVAKAPAAKAPPPAPPAKPVAPVAKVATPPKPAPKPVAQQIAPPAPEKTAEAPPTPEPPQASEPAESVVANVAKPATPEPPAAPKTTEVAEAKTPEPEPEPEKSGFFDFLRGSTPQADDVTEEPEAAAPKVALNEPAELPEQYRVAEAVSPDYSSTVGPNPTPDTAPDIDALNDADEPSETPAAEASPPPPTFETVSLDTPSSRASEPAEADEPAEQTPEEKTYEPLAAFASLFGGGETEEDAPEPAAEETEAAEGNTPPEPAQPLAANALLPADIEEEVQPAPEPTLEAEENPYPGGFEDDKAYETAQLAQPGFGYAAPAPAGRGYNPNAPVTVAILTPDSDSRPSIRTLAKGLSQAAALSARTLGNRQLVLRGYDTGGSPEKAQLAAQQAVSDGAQLIIGPLFSSSAAAVAPIAQRAGIPVIAFTTNGDVLRRGIYSVGYLPDAEVERMLSFAAKRGIRKIGLLSPDTPYGGIVYRTVQNTATGHGVNIATVQPISPNFAQAAETGKRFAEFYGTNPDVQGVLIATNGKALQGIAAYLAYNDVLPSQVQYMGLGIWDDSETFREATLRGGWFPGLDPALKAEFESRYSSAYGSKPPAVAALAYDGVAIAGALLERAKSTGQPPFTIQNIETPTGFRGMSGLFRFLPNGRNQRLLSILKVGRRQFEMVDPAPTTFGQRLSSITGYSQ